MLNKKSKLKIFISMMILISFVVMLNYDILASATDSNIQKYVDTVDNTEYEDINVVYKFLTMLTSYDRQYVDNNKQHFINKYYDFFGCKVHMDEKSNISQDMRQLSKHNKYALAINRANNQLTVYGFDENKNAYNTPLVSFICTCNKTKTPLGKFYTKEKYNWRIMLNGSYAQYATRITQNFLIHSTPYNSNNIFDLDIEKFNELSGEGKSDGCVRLKAEDAYWLYKNLNDHALVVIYDGDVKHEPLDKPIFIRITDERITFDPTDPAITGKW